MAKVLTLKILMPNHEERQYQVILSLRDKLDWLEALPIDEFDALVEEVDDGKD